MTSLQRDTVNRKLADEVETRKSLHTHFCFKRNAHLANPGLQRIGFIARKNDFVGIRCATSHPGSAQHTTRRIHCHRSLHTAHGKFRHVARQKSGQKLIGSLHFENRDGSFIKDHQIQSHFLFSLRSCVSIISLHARSQACT